MVAPRKLAIGILSFSAAAWVRQISTLVLYAVGARLLDPGAIGVFALASTLVLAIEYGVGDSISEAVVQREILEPGHLGAALFIAGAAAVGATVASVALSAWLSRLFDVPDLATILPYMTGAVGFLCFSWVHGGILRRHARFHLLSLLSVVAALVACGLGIVLMVLGWGVWSLVGYFLAEKLVLGGGLIAFATRHPLAWFSRRHISDVAGYSAAIFGQRIAFFLRNQMDRLLIAWLWGPDVLGAYQLAAKIFESASSTLLAPASKLLFVSYSRLQGDIAQLRTMFFRSLEAIAFVAFPAFAGIAMVGPEVVRILFGNNWQHSELILQVIALGGIPLVVSVMSGAVVSAVGRARTFLVIELVAAVLGAILLAALSRLGIIWIAAAFVLRETAIVIVYMSVVGRILHTNAYRCVQTFSQFLAMSVAMMVLIMPVKTWVTPGLSAYASLAVLAALGATFYAGAMWVTRKSEFLRAIAVMRGDAPRAPGAQ